MKRNGKALTLEQILSAEDRKPMTADVPEWGGSVNYQAMSVVMRERVGLALNRQDDEEGLQAMVVGWSLCDDEGNPLGRDEDGTPRPLDRYEIDQLGQKSSAPIRRLFDLIMEASGMTEEAQKATEKNSEKAPNESSS